MSPIAQKTGGPKELSDSFLQLQNDFLMLRPIHTKKEYSQAVRVAAELTSRERMTKAQADYLESLTNNIMAYENKKMITKKTNPIEILHFLLEENDLTGSDLGRLLGQRQLGAKILKGSRKLNLNHIKKIAGYFSVSPELFI